MVPTAYDNSTTITDVPSYNNTACSDEYVNSITYTFVEEGDFHQDMLDEIQENKDNIKALSDFVSRLAGIKSKNNNHIILKYHMRKSFGRESKH